MTYEILSIEKVSRLRNSVNGNPRYLVAATDRNGGDIILKTSPDAGWVYSGIVDSAEGRLMAVEYHTTPTGRKILDHLKTPTESELLS